MCVCLINKTNNKQLPILLCILINKQLKETVDACYNKQTVKGDSCCFPSYPAAAAATVAAAAAAAVAAAVAAAAAAVAAAVAAAAAAAVAVAAAAVAAAAALASYK